jgi:hypothetical protein
LMNSSFVNLAPTPLMVKRIFLSSAWSATLFFLCPEAPASALEEGSWSAAAAGPAALLRRPPRPIYFRLEPRRALPPSWPSGFCVGSSYVLTTSPSSSSTMI